METAESGPNTRRLESAHNRGTLAEGEGGMENVRIVSARGAEALAGDGGGVEKQVRSKETDSGAVARGVRSAAIHLGPVASHDGTLERHSGTPSIRRGWWKGSPGCRLLVTDCWQLSMAQ